MLQVNKIVIKGHQARYGHISNPGKPVVLLLPGNLQEIETVKPFNEHLGKDFDYFVLEVPGTGLTKPMHPKYNMAYMASLIDEFCKTYINRKFYLVALSYSTPAALEYCKLSTSVTRLCLAGSMKSIPESVWPRAFKLMSDSMENKKNFADNFINELSIDHPDIPRRRSVLKAAKIKAKRYTDDQYWCFVYNSIRIFSYYPEHLHKIQCPTLCFTGELDPYVKREWCEELALSIPNAVFTTISCTDHLFLIQKPHETVNLVSDFLFENHSLETS